MKWKNRSLEGVLWMDSKGKILFANQAAEKMFGVRKGGAKGKYCYDIVEGWDPAGNRFCFEGCSVMKMAQKNEPVRDMYLQVRAPKGKERWLNVTTLVESKREGQAGKNIVHILRPAPSGMEVVCLPEGIIATLNNRITKNKQDIKKYRPQSAPSLPPGVSLTSREMEILGYVTEGKVAKEIAQNLGISLATVRSHIQNILRKLGVHSKLEAVVMLISSN